MAGWLYHENFISLPIKSEIETRNDVTHIEFNWKINGSWNYLKSVMAESPTHYTPGSYEYFILNHYFAIPV